MISQKIKISFQALLLSVLLYSCSIENIDPTDPETDNSRTQPTLVKVLAPEFMPQQPWEKSAVHPRLLVSETTKN
jgi:hypothetical protein